MKESDSVDTIIREALTADEARFYDSLGEPSVHEMLLGVFEGKRRWLAILATVYTFVFFGVAVWAGFEFFGAEGTRDMLMWLGIFMFSMLAVSMLKMWYYMEMNRNQIMRELKRMELQLTHLMGQSRAQ